MVRTKKKVSFITTVFNEETTIRRFLDSLLVQSRIPEEIIIVDGGSSDRTVAEITNYKSKIKNFKGVFKVLIKKGNRSVGRNEAIRHATGEIIVCSDSGNILDKQWVEEIVKPFIKGTTKAVKLTSASSLGEEQDEGVGYHAVDVVAGYYQGQPENIFQKCVIPYALVMEDKLNPDDFLPATRSIAFTRIIWEKAGGFEERFSHNEDYVFARKLKEIGAKIVFAKKAIVYWLPRNTYKSAYIMMWRFALGDAEANIWRTKVLLLFARYFVGLYLFFLTLLYRSLTSFGIITLFLCLYIFWSIEKNYRYVKDLRAFFILPRLQFTADAAVLIGTAQGAFKIIKQIVLLALFKKNKALFLVIGIYILILLSTITYGVPNANHPFPYNMDEWHSLQAVRATFKDGTPNISGAANGTMLHFIVTGFYLAPFALLHFINPFVLKLTDYVMRERIFILLRINSIIFGAMSIIMMYVTAKKMKVPSVSTILLFTFTPAWLMLTGFYRYDIELLFWIIVTIYFFYRYVENPDNRNYIIAAIPAGLTMAVKISALPVVPVYLALFLYHRGRIKNFRYLIAGFAILIVIVLLFGMPDLLYGRGNIVQYFLINVFRGPASKQNISLGMNHYMYLYSHHYPLIYGHALWVLFIFSTVFLVSFVMLKILQFAWMEHKQDIFLLFAFLMFLGSLLPLGLDGIGYRSLVLLPFIIFISVRVLQLVNERLKFPIILSIIVGGIIVVQLYESLAWISLKLAKSPQEVASVWLITHIAKHRLIGIENIPIYQNLPDLVEKEFYYGQYNVQYKYTYKYVVINSASVILPPLVILTNDRVGNKIFKQSESKLLISRLQKDGYEKVALFQPDFARIHTDDIDYYFAGINANPASTSVYILRKRTF